MPTKLDHPTHTAYRVKREGEKKLTPYQQEQLAEVQKRMQEHAERGVLDVLEGRPPRVF